VRRSLGRVMSQHELRSSLSLSIVALLAVAGCHYFPDHFLGHPTRVPDRVVTWVDDVTIGDLRVHVRGARPAGGGPLPAVVVLPEAGKTAEDMEPIAWDLATSGYFAIGANYERRTNGDYETQLFPWRSAPDVDAIFAVLAHYPEVDPQRVGLLGFSQGGVLALLIAAHAPDRVRAVVSYYPVTDFPTWLAKENGSLWQRFSFFFVRRYFRQESGARSDAEFEHMLEVASPYFVAAAIEAPVLLVHGDEDTTAPIEESRRMAERLEELGKPVRLLVIPGGVHIFNFRQPEAERVAWRATLEWFDRYLHPAPSAAGSNATPD
jgi:dienelactone hydrolase